MIERITPLSEREIENRPAQLANALTQINLAEEVVAMQPGKEYRMDGCRDGEKLSVVIDAQVIQAMKGGASRLYSDVKEHYPGLAETIAQSHAPKK